jgi:hypothetical protein
MCDVPSLIGVNTRNAQETWNAAGLSGVVIFTPDPPPNWNIGWQSLTVDSQTVCTSGIIVRKDAP